MDVKQLKRLIKYSSIYEINIQFWPNQISVFLAKDGIDLNSWGSSTDDFAINEAVKYLDRINRKSIETKR